ncbi:MAG: UDP-glucose 6-dehydrogenase [Candidatus Moranbacteria bacterium GW2011_GWE1_49_15]|nr:MAG: UDP-glucose 6-dehydrogenase [Candidatus Moranbacteria bacterium GW2011_GWE1_49_15]
MENQEGKRITIVGTGYVGLVTGACFAEMGIPVTCVDKRPEIVQMLCDGKIPIHEPGLEPMVLNNYAEGRLRFTTSLPEAMAESNVYFIAVGTPQGEDGSADLQHVLAVAREIGQNLSGYVVVVNKSTVPVMTADKVRAAIQEELDKRGADFKFDVVSNPEFLKEGAAVVDFMKPDRIVIGVDDQQGQAAEIMRRLYAPFNRNHERTIFMGVRDAEMTKYAANAMLATKISFINEIAGICDALDVDVENVRRGIGSDSRIGYSFIYPGAGYGGSCFPKDVKALLRTAEDCEVDPVVLRGVEVRNQAQKKILFRKITAKYGNDLSGLVFAVWGLAFKPETDDMREATSMVLLHQLIGAGAKVLAYDPVAMDVARKIFPKDWLDHGHLVLVDHQYDAIKGADALILVTEWKCFRSPDLHLLKREMRQKAVFDGRNQYDPKEIKEAGFEYSGIGRR